MWVRSKILLSSMLSSVVGVIYPIALSTKFGFEFVGLWVSVRAFIQLGATLIPNYINSFIYLPDSYSVKKLYYVISGASLALALYLVISSLFYAFGSDFILMYALPVSIYGGAFLLAGYSTMLARAAQRSDVILKLSSFDAAASIIIIGYVLYFNSIQFLFYASAVKELLRLIAVLISLGPRFFLAGDPRKDVRADKILRSHSYQHVIRSFYQVLSQHGDRALYPLVFGLIFSGEGAIGSSLAMLWVMITSSGYAWALPLVINNVDKKYYILNQWRMVYVFCIVSALFAWAISYYVNNSFLVLKLGLPSISDVLLVSYCFSTAVGCSFILALLDKKRFVGSFYVFMSLLALAATWIVVISAHKFFDFGAVISIVVGLNVFLLVNGVLNKNFFTYKDYLLLVTFGGGVWLPVIF